jgi:hypothetical protein
MRAMMARTKKEIAAVLQLEVEEVVISKLVEMGHLRKTVIEDEVLHDYTVIHELPHPTSINKRKFKGKKGDTIQLNEFEADILKHYVTKTR